MPFVRKLLPDDVSAYRAIRLEALRTEPGSYGSTYEEEAKKTRLAFEIYIEQQPSNGVAFGAFLNDELIGITVWMGDERTRLRHRAKIGQVYVRAVHRGKGIGNQLMRSTIDDAFEQPLIEALSLEVVNSNASAIRLYESLGFETYGVFERYFKTETCFLDQRFMVLYKQK